MSPKLKPAPVPSLPSTVLMVDDEDVVLDVLAKVLGKRGLQYRTAHSGEEAVKLLEKERFGCLLTDKNLPGMSGLEVIRASRRLQPFCACIMITGYASMESVLEAMRLGAVDYLEKPFPEMGLVVQKIESAIKNQRTLFERNTLVEVLRSMQAELREKSEKVFAQRTELEMLDSVVEVRVDEATADLRRRCDALDARLRSDRELDRTLLQDLEVLLAYVREVDLEGEGPAVMRGVLREVERRVEAAAALLREGG